MRRPAVYFSGMFGAGILTAYVFDINVYISILSATAAMIFSIWTYLKDFNSYLKRGALILCAVTLGGSWFGLNEMKIDPLVKQEGKNVKVQGIVTEADFKEDSCNLVIRNDSGKSLVKYYGNSDHIEECKGKTVNVTGVVELPQGQRNPRCFDYRFYLRTCDIQSIIRAGSVKIVQGKEIPYLKMTGSVHNTFREKIKMYVDDSAQGLIIAILFGDKTMMDEDIYSDFQKNGTAHILAVSGLHTGIIYAFFVFLWRWKKGSLFYFTVSVMLLLYMSLADFSPSVVRASCMIFLHLAAGLFRCRYDLMTAAGITFAAMLLWNPYQLFNTGFQLSFLAVASLAVIIPFVKRYYQGLFLSAIAIQAGMVPYNAFVFNYISIGSILANIPIIFIAGIMLPAGICAIVSMTLPGELFGFFIKMMEICGELLIKINDFFYISGKTSFDVISPPVWLLVIYYGTLFTVLSESGQLMMIRKQKKRIAMAVVCICMTAIISVHAAAEPFDDAGIVFVDVGQGDCIHIKTDSGKNYLIDGGGDDDYDVGLKTLKPYLLRNGVLKVDAAFVTHLHEDHYGGIKSLSLDGMVDTVGVYEANRQIDNKLRKELHSDIIFLHRGYMINLDDNISLEVIAPEKYPDPVYKKMIENEEDENKSSLIIKVRYKGKTILVTGDIDEDGEKELIKNYESELPCDIIKVPHHGSKYSSSEAFIEKVSPALAVFQVGRNNYGHPSNEVIDRYREKNCEITRNDINGAIGLIVNEDKSLKVINMSD